MIILLYVELGFFIHTNDNEFINSKKELKSFEFPVKNLNTLSSFRL